jgi:hypothetical protein
MGPPGIVDGLHQAVDSRQPRVGLCMIIMMRRALAEQQPGLLSPAEQHCACRLPSATHLKWRCNASDVSFPALDSTRHTYL